MASAQHRGGTGRRTRDTLSLFSLEHCPDDTATRQAHGDVAAHAGAHVGDEALGLRGKQTALV